MRPNQTLKFLHSKANYQENQKPPTDWQKIFANDTSDKGLILKTHTELMTQYKQTNKQPDIKMGRVPEQIFFQRRHAGAQQVNGKVLNITNYQENANENQNEISLHTSQNVYHQKAYK